MEDTGQRDELGEEQPGSKRELRLALGEAVRYVESMRVVPGGLRDKLRCRWRKLLGWEPVD